LGARIKGGEEFVVFGCGSLKIIKFPQTKIAIPLFFRRIAIFFQLILLQGANDIKENKRVTLFTFGSPSCIYDSCRIWSVP
jgi:hypothetical protein